VTVVAARPPVIGETPATTARILLSLSSLAFLGNHFTLLGIDIKPVFFGKAYMTFTY
jgi:hypothetical protein